MPGSATSRLSSPTLIGRGETLDALLLAATRAPALVLLEGEAGVGKTRLVRELLGNPALATRRRLVGHCHDMREPFPLGPAIEALRQTAGTLASARMSPVAGALRPLLPELAGELPPALEPLGDARAERHRVFRGLLELLGALGPTVLVLEDLHWIDTGSREFLRFLVAQLPAGLSLVLTYRREGLAPLIGSLLSRLPEDGVREKVSLDPLGRDDVLRLVAALLERDDVPPELGAYLYERTGGLPLAVEEVVRLLVDRRAHLAPNRRWTRAMLEALEVPDVLRDSILERVATLGRDAGRLTRASAVLARPASEELLSAIAGLPAARGRSALTRALGAGVLREEEPGRYGFRHALATQAVSESMSGPDRRELHRRAARALEAQGEPLPLAQLARHYRQADERARWLWAAEAAADRSAALGDDALAAELLREVLDGSALPPADLGRLAVKLARAAYTGLEVGETIPILRRALDEPGLPQTARGELRFDLGLLLMNYAGRFHGREEFVRAVDELEERPDLAAQVMAALAIPVYRDGSVDEHLEWMERAVGVARRTGDPKLEALIATRRAQVLVAVGDPAGWRAVTEIPSDGATLEERRELAKAYGNLAYGAALVGYLHRSTSFLERAFGLVARAEDVNMKVSLDSTRVFVDWAAGRWDGLEERTRLLAESPIELIGVEARAVSGLLLLARGDERRAEDELAFVREAAAEHGAVALAPLAATGLGRLLLARGDAEVACERALEGLAPLREKGFWVLATELAPVAVDALLACGANEDAHELERAFAAGLVTRDAPGAATALAVCRARLAEAEGRTEDAARALAAAAEAFLELPRPYESARALERCGACLLAAGSDEGGHALLDALDRLEALGAAWDVARVRATLRRHGVFLRRRGGRRSYGGELSPREREVALLAARGRTNREIAETLVLSPRTVEEHVAHVLKKLGVDSRRALAGLGGRLDERDTP